MSDSGVLDPTKTVTGRGGGGRFGREDDPSRTGDPPDDDLRRLARMLERIGKTLDRLVRLEPRLVPEPLATNLAGVWPEAQSHVTEIVKILRSELLMAALQVNLVELLERAGLTGAMLRMKEASLIYCLNRVDGMVEAYQQKFSQSDRPILTYPERKGVVRRFLGWVKASLPTVNSVLSSLPDVLPGKEILKEFKEHLEGGYAVAEQLGEQEEG